MAFERLRDLARTLKRELAYYRALRRHPRTPWLSRALLWLALAYALSPIDLIPDWLPVIGHLDDLIVVPLLLYLALRLIPHAVRDEVRAGRDVPDHSADSGGAGLPK